MSTSTKEIEEATILTILTDVADSEENLKKAEERVKRSIEAIEDIIDRDNLTDYFLSQLQLEIEGLQRNKVRYLEEKKLVNILHKIRGKVPKA